MTDDLWASASQDTERENHDRTFTSLRLEAAKFWPILSSATSATDFANRYAVIEDKLDVLAAKEANGNPAVYAALKDELRTEFERDFRTAANYGDTSPHQADWAATRGKILEKTDKCPYCKGAKTRSGDASAICGKHGDEMRNSYATHPASENYWTSSLHTTANQYIKQQGDSWVITQKGTGKVLSHHSSQEQAEKAFAAMESNMHGGSKTADSHYEDGLGCPYCKWTGSKLEDRKKHIEDKHPGKPSGFSLGAKDDTDDDDFPELDMGLDAVDKAQDKKGSKESDIDPWDPDAEGNAYEHKEGSLRVEAANFTRQHFNTVAEGIRTAPVDEETREVLAKHFARHLATTNPRFNPDRFIGASTHTAHTARTAMNPLDNDFDPDDPDYAGDDDEGNEAPKKKAKTSGAHVPQWGPTTADPNFFAAPAESQNNTPPPTQGTPGSNAGEDSSAHPEENLDKAPEPNTLDSSVVVSKRWVDANKSFYEVSSSRHVAEEGVHQDSLWGDNGYDYWKYFNENPPGHNRSDDEKPISDNQREQWWSKEVNK